MAQFDLTAAQLDLRVPPGSSLPPVEMTFQDTTGQLLDLTGILPKVILTTRMGVTVPVAFAFDLSQAGRGVLILSLSAQQVAALPRGNRQAPALLLWTLVAEFPDTSVWQLAYGNFRVEGGG